MAFTSYKEIRPWARAIQSAVQSRTMPPWHADPHYGSFSNDSRLSDADVNSIVAWAKGGAPEGDPRLTPPLPQFSTGWHIGKPDAIFTLPTASIEADQQTFSLDTNFKEDVWVDAIEILPGNRKLVHHAQVWLATPDQPTLPTPTDSCATTPSRLGILLASFVPGQPPDTWPAGIATRIPAGARLRFVVHYSKSTNADERDATRLGLRFAQTPVRQELRRINLHNDTFLIPAQAENHLVTACHILKEDADLLSYLAHMHYRGRGMKFEATFPDGRTEVLLNIPRYAFEWQTKYRNATPVRLPQGTLLRLTATFDNSPNNRSNPDPTRAIPWGDNTSDEMMDGWLEFVTPLADK